MSEAAQRGVLSILVSPMSRVLDRMSFASKFLIATLVAMTVCSLLLGNQYRTLNAMIAGDDKESKGIHFAEPLFHLLQSAQSYRGMTQSVLVGSMDLVPKQEAALKSATEDMAKVQSLAQRYDADLGTQVIATDLDAAWKNYMAPRPSDPKSAFDLHNQFMYSVLKAMDQAADLSNVALDPEAHTYYLGLLDFGQIPAAHEHLARLRGFGSRLLVTGQINEGDANQLKLMLFEAKRQIREVRATYNKAAKANPDTKKQLDAKVANAEDAVLRMLDKIHYNLLTIDAESEAREFDSKGYFQLVTGVMNHLAELQSATNTLLHHYIEVRLSAQQHSLYFTLSLTILGMLLLMYVLAAVYSSIQHSVRDASAQMARLAAGDLSQSVVVSSRDELAEINHQLNRMTENWRVIVKDINSLAERTQQELFKVNLSASEIRGNTDAQSDGSQAIASSVEEFSVGLQSAANASRSVTEASQHSAEAALRSADLARDVAGFMGNMASQVEDTAVRVSHLGSSLDGIRGFVVDIKELTDQTNLLALNAAIEAARAGEHGRGFAVVADEVRKLAVKTAETTAQITGLVEAVEQGIRESLNTTHQSTSSAREAVNRMKQVADAVMDIRRQSEAAVLEVMSISDTVREQSTASELIAREIEQIAQGSEKIALQARDVSEQADVLSTVQQELMTTVSRFRL